MAQNETLRDIVHMNNVVFGGDSILNSEILSNLAIYWSSKTMEISILDVYLSSIHQLHMKATDVKEIKED